MELRVRQLGRADYQSTWHAMREFTDARNADTGDELWLVEHLPVFTQGQAGRAEHLLDAGTIPVVQSDRGGQITYHGPGQLVAYPLLDLRRLHMGVRDLVDVIEQTIIAVLEELDIAAQARPDAPGVYVDGAKIASLGLRVRRGCSFHGLALNVNMDLEPFARINPCGYAGMSMVDIERLRPGRGDMASVQTQLVDALVQKLGYKRAIMPSA